MLDVSLAMVRYTGSVNPSDAHAAVLLEHSAAYVYVDASAFGKGAWLDAPERTPSQPIGTGNEATRKRTHRHQLARFLLPHTRAVTKYFPGDRSHGDCDACMSH